MKYIENLITLINSLEIESLLGRAKIIFFRRNSYVFFMYLAGSDI